MISKLQRQNHVLLSLLDSSLQITELKLSGMAYKGGPGEAPRGEKSWSCGKNCFITNIALNYQCLVKTKSKLNLICFIALNFFADNVFLYHLG